MEGGGEREGGERDEDTHTHRKRESFACIPTVHASLKAVYFSLRLALTQKVTIVMLCSFSAC